MRGILVSGQKIFEPRQWLGGTELMMLALEKHVIPHVPSLADWNWIVAPGEINLREDGKNIAWVHLGEFEGDLSWLEHPLVAHVIFVSHFQYQRFTERYRIAHKSHVLKNAITPLKNKKKPTDTINLIFHSEPYRGLDILLDALSQIEDEDIRLHVFGDLNTDTIDWKIEFQDAIKERCEKDSRVVLHGRTSNKEVRKQLQKTHIFAYPSTWRETSCLCLIEALSAGCLCVTSNLTALPETSMGFANHYEMRYEPSQHVDTLVPELKSAIKVVRSGFDSTIQKTIIDDAYSWESRLLDWINFSHKIGPAKTG